MHLPNMAPSLCGRWIDLEVLDGAVGALKELLNAPDGATSILQTDGALDTCVALLAVGEVRRGDVARHDVAMTWR